MIIAKKGNTYHISHLNIVPPDAEWHRPLDMALSVLFTQIVTYESQGYQFVLSFGNIQYKTPANVAPESKV